MNVEIIASSSGLASTKVIFRLAMDVQAASKLTVRWELHVCSLSRPFSAASFMTLNPRVKAKELLSLFL